MKISNIALILLTSLILSCDQTQKEAPLLPEKTKMLFTHYYAVKMENGIPTRDTLMDCFHCNQAIVYDKTGKELELRFYKKNGKDKFGYEEYQYNTEGNKVGSKYFENDTLVSVYKYELDEQKNIAIGRAFDVNTDKMLYGYRHKYDAKDNQIETENLNGKDEIQDYYRRVFNEKGIVLSENIVDLDGNPTFKIKYEYRPQADHAWIEQLTYYDDQLSEIRLREKVPF